ncbi:hypothetical protein ACSQ67_021960 [Phaseolus vulgaris]
MGLFIRTTTVFTLFSLAFLDQPDAGIVRETSSTICHSSMASSSSQPLPPQPSPFPLLFNLLLRYNIALPLYQSNNEGQQHAPRFRSKVWVDGMSYISQSTFSHRKTAEQDAARLALKCLSKRTRDEAPSLDCEVCCCKIFGVGVGVDFTAFAFGSFTSLMALSLTSHGVNKYQKCGVEEEDGSQSTNGLSAITQCSPLCGIGNDSIFKGAKEKQQHGESSSSGWLYSEPNAHSDSLNESAAQELVLRKRSFMIGVHRERPCKLPMPRSHAQLQVKQQNQSQAHPMSVAAKNVCTSVSQNKRERISEGLKILQELVPNGSKVDLVTMLEKAISYVKFLQLQVKVLAADEFWPVQGGKAPDISQVRQAIDAILSSQ